jgi:hypothetical protein
MVLRVKHQPEAWKLLRVDLLPAGVPVMEIMCGLQIPLLTASAMQVGR